MNARAWMLTWSRCAELHRRACTSKLVLADEHERITRWRDHPLAGHYGETCTGVELRKAAMRHAHVAELAHERKLLARERVELVVLAELAVDAQGRW